MKNYKIIYYGLIKGERKNRVHVKTLRCENLALAFARLLLDENILEVINVQLTGKVANMYLKSLEK